MTIKQCIKKCGWQQECTSTVCRVMSVDVDFVNSDGKEDETQFDIRAYDEAELSELYAAFCEENKYPRNTVISVTVVQMADSMETLF